MNKQSIINQCATLLTQIKTYVPEGEAAKVLHDGVERIKADVEALGVCPTCSACEKAKRVPWDHGFGHIPPGAWVGHGLTPPHERHPPSYNPNCRDCSYYRYYDSPPVGARCSRGVNNCIYDIYNGN